MINGHMTKAGKSQCGVVILEAMLAILIFSVGILGLVGSLGASVKNATAAQYRTEAAFHAETLIARLRTADPATRTTTYASPAGTDYVNWKDLVTTGSNALPGSQKTANLPTVAFSGTGNRTVTVNLRWQTTNDAAARTYTVVTALE